MAAASGDVHEYLIYAGRNRIKFPIFDADGDLVTGATALDSEISKDQGAFADCVNEAVEIGSSGLYYLDLTSAECTAKSIDIVVKTTTAGAKTTPRHFSIRRPMGVWSGTAQAGGASQITLDSGASARDGAYVGLFVIVSNNSPANALGQARKILTYNGSTKIATVEAAWGTAPSSASTFQILAGDPADMSSILSLEPRMSSDSRLQVDVEEWRDESVAVPTVNGVPETDVTHLNGVSQSLLDLKDFDTPLR